MPPWLTEALRLLGFTTPFVYAAATYGLFHYLDKRASGAAKQAMHEWISSSRYNKEQIANLLVTIFERLYGYPFFSIRTMFRLVLISFALHLLVFAFMGWLGLIFYPISKSAFPILFAVVFSCNVTCDYLSLFLMRYWLIMRGRRPLTALIVGPLLGAIIIYAVYVTALWLGNPSKGISEPMQIWTIIPMLFGFYESNMYFHPSIVVPLVLPAVAIHLWLPVFALAVILAQALSAFAKATNWMQWFLKQGRHHPFQATGYVAAAIVFVSTVVVQVIRA